MGFIPLLDPSARCQQPARPWNEADGTKTSHFGARASQKQIDGVLETFPNRAFITRFLVGKNKTKKKADGCCEMNGAASKEWNPSKTGCKFVAVGVWRDQGGGCSAVPAPHQLPCFCESRHGKMCQLKSPPLQTSKYQIAATKAFPNDLILSQRRIGSSLSRPHALERPWVGKAEVERSPRQVLCSFKPPPCPLPESNPASPRARLGFHLQDGDDRSMSLPPICACLLEKRERNSASVPLPRPRPRRTHRTRT